MKDHFVVAVIANTLSGDLRALGPLVTPSNSSHNMHPAACGYLALDSLAHFSGNVIDACVGKRHLPSGNCLFVVDSA